MPARIRLSATCLLGIFASVTVPSASFATENRVGIENFTFVPEVLQVSPGTTVVFENKDDIPHQVVASDNSLRSRALDTGEKFSYTFTKPGTFAYFCGLHPHMTGKIVVK